MDSLTSLTSFVRTAETLSFVQAARLLGISASAVGKNVARLEHKLGVRLFNRSTRNVSLTAEGAAFLTRCQSILEQIQEAESELTSSLSQPTGKLRISLPVIGYRLLLPALTAFTRLYPQVELDLDFSDRLVNLIDEGFDVAIRSGELADSRLIARKLGAFVLCSAPARPIWRNTGPRLAKGIGGAQVHFFRFPSTGLIQPRELRDMRLTGDFRAAAVVTVNNIEAAIRLSAAGMGIAYVPDFVVREAMDEGQLHEVLPGCCVKDGHFSVLWPASRYLSPRIRCFIDFMAAAEIPLSPASATPPPLKSPAPDILPPGQRKPAAGAHHQSSVSTMRPITRYFCASKR
ncbi:LysR substrate-binding domain-containing protein [Klebsiella variicola subsp. variicola]|nr:LysR substrate-binding domain-containing protein [Klebsiella variicola subsp. variicola]